ncbi:MAG: hypothetical protein AB2A00_00430 [Myxococcota bacterium]
MTYPLDANVIHRFRDAGALDVLAAVTSQLPVVVVKEVLDELTAPGHPDANKMARWFNAQGGGG